MIMVFMVSKARKVTWASPCARKNMASIEIVEALKDSMGYSHV
jgi:hypothetical protein